MVSLTTDTAPKPTLTLRGREENQADQGITTLTNSPMRRLSDSNVFPGTDLSLHRPPSSPFLCGEPVVLLQRSEVKIRESLDLPDAHLIGLVSAEAEGPQMFEQFRLTDHIGRGRLSPVGDHRDHLPIFAWQAHAAIFRVIVAKDRSGEHRDFQLVRAAILQNIIFKSQPGLLIELFMLWRTVAEVKGVFVRDGRLASLF